MPKTTMKLTCSRKSRVRKARPSRIAMVKHQQAKRPRARWINMQEGPKGAGSGGVAPPPDNCK